jgi:beta-phosphoglucomutase-like phosphatase (HAD superfamily)
VTRLERLISGASHLLLDFDGPVCSVYAGVPPERVAAEMLARAVDCHVKVPAELQREADPMVVLEWAGASQNQELIELLDSTLTRAEVDAVLSATFTDGAIAVIDRANMLGMPIAVVSNNSADCIVRFLEMHGLAEKITAIAARPPGQPEKMKPDPYIVLRALDLLGAKPEASPFVGDSFTDIQVARTVGIQIIALANKSSKIAPFTATEPDALITSMSTLADAFPTRNP